MKTGVAFWRGSMAKQGPDPASQLLEWYGVNARVLPWRAGPGEAPDPYRVWLSEIMLQQTTVQAVKGYFERFIARWPTVEALAAASLDDVLRAWAGLGYYARARNLHACAKVVVARHGGAFPGEEKELRALPGIGAYTAAAVAAIAFGKPCAAIDGNVERVIARWKAIKEPLPGAKPLIRGIVQPMVPHARPGGFAQALMDLGAAVCAPKSPNCAICPWAEHCLGRKRGIAGELPRRAAKKEIPTRRGVAFWLERDDGAVLLRRRPEKGLLGGMMEVPSTEWAAKPPAKPARAAPVPAKWRKLPGLVEHTFTHFHLELSVLRAGGSGSAPEGCRWVARSELPGEALPTVMRKIVALALGEG